MFRRYWFHYYLRVCTELQVLSKTASSLWFYAYKKYKNGNSVRRTYLQRHIRRSITQNGSDNFSSGISGNLPKIATSNVICSRTADRIAKFCMTIQKIKPNDIFQNCVHSTSTLTLFFTKSLHWGHGTCFITCWIHHSIFRATKTCKRVGSVSLLRPHH